jgi:hypothetical protein
MSAVSLHGHLPLLQQNEISLTQIPGGQNLSCIEHRSLVLAMNAIT